MTKKERREKLLSLGFLENGFPAYLGGTWNHRGMGVTANGVGTRDEYAQRGIFPPIPAIQETETLRRSLRTAVEDALKLIPREQKEAYLEAVERSPHLVRKESDALHFARVENYDVWAAAGRLARYWALRKELFEDRAFLPMTQTGGRGALSREDLVVLNSGTVALLPEDNMKRGVFYNDRSRMVGTSSAAILSRSRCAFYLGSILCENEVNQTEGFVAIIVALLPRVTEFFHKNLYMGIKLTATLPLRVKAFHLIVRPPKAGNKTPVERIVSAQFRFIAERYGIKSTILHLGNSEEEILRQLEKFGLSASGLPPVAGGSWKYEYYRTWLRRRCDEEQKFEHRMQQQSGSENGGGERKPRAALGWMETKERKRKQNIVYSRQKRERQKTQEENLKTECRQLKEQNRRVAEDNRRLEGLLAMAESMIASNEETAASGAVAMPGTSSMGLPRSALVRGYEKSSASSRTRTEDR
jgi:hypothetical protein